MNQQDLLQQPFFARFLETQQKAQSNNEELVPWPNPIPTSPIKDLEHTQKYPSDGDEI